MIEKGLMMKLEKEFITTVVPGTAFDPSFEPIIVKALQKVAGVV